MDSVTFKGNL